MSSITAGSQPASTPVSLSITSGFLWMVLMLVAGALVFYFVGLDQGAVSVFGNDTHIHEFVHDARHFLGFPCH
jgi:hypothetical protein